NEEARLPVTRALVHLRKRQRNPPYATQLASAHYGDPNNAGPPSSVDGRWGLIARSADLHRLVHLDRTTAAQPRAPLGHDDGIVKIGRRDDRVAGRRVRTAPLARRSIRGNRRHVTERRAHINHGVA